MNLNDKRIFLENVCGKTWAVLSRVESGQVKISKARLYCRSWLCPVCKKKRAKGFANATLSFFGNSQVRMFSVTDAHRGTLESAYETFSSRWNKFRLYLQRAIGTFKYVRVLEPQPKSGFPHYHVLVDKYIAKEVLVETLVASGFGPITDITLLQSEDAFFYVLKYLKKEWPHEKALEICNRLHMRRCSGSFGFSVAGTGSGNFKLLGIYSDHNFVTTLVNSLYKHLIDQGCILSACNDTNDFFELSLDPPRDGSSFFDDVQVEALNKNIKDIVAVADWLLPE